MAESYPQQEPLSRTLAGGSEYFFDYVCQPCTVDNKTLEAVGFCVTCTELLCDDCYRSHLKPTPTRNHKLLGIEDAKKDQNFASSRDLCTEICPEHPQEIIKYFCKTHNTLGCTACMTEDHRTCTGVQHIPKVAEAEANGQEYSGLVHKLDTFSVRTRRLIRYSTDNKAKSQKQCDGVLDDVRKVKKEVMEAFEKLENDMKMEADKTKNKQMQKMDENIAVFDNIQQRADNLMKTFKSMNANGQYCKLFIAMKVEMSAIHSLGAKLDMAANDNNVADVKFQPCKQLEKLLKRRNSMGNIFQQDSYIRNTASLGNQKYQVSDMSSTTIMEQQSQKDSDTRSTAASRKTKPLTNLPHDSINSKATKVGDINVKTADDCRKCSINGLDSLPNGRLVATDYNNRKVKLIDVEQSRVLFAMSVPRSPLDITTIDEPDKIAISLLGSQKILVVKVTGGILVEDREILTSKYYYGIASIKHNIVVSPIGQGSLDIIDKHGNVLRTIEHDQLSCYGLSLAASQQCDAIYVPDNKMNTMTCVTTHGEVKYVQTHSDLIGARGTAVDSKGAVYVGGERSSNIFQIIPDTRKISVLLSAKDGIEYFRSLCCTAETDCLFVGQDSDSILIFQLS